MKVTLICVGALKEAYYRAAAAEYLKRLRPYAQVSVYEVAEERPPANPSAADEAAVRDREAERVAKLIPPGSFVVALAIEGRQRSSEDLAEWIQQLQVQGQSHLCLIIGGSTGLSPTLDGVIATKWSFGLITLPHQLARIVLLEQIYRAFKIMRNEPYHK
ncbi:MAG TPA: 23S rRNA (pseudouridine(1915)-N(3))-methyltransferase RlmH [Bacillota bacterium]|nr:23S rRNA (pseudouridine(1915)-N(3))-methyltransferase RlmH [Bacillota bacterium]